MGTLGEASSCGPDLSPRSQGVVSLPAQPLGPCSCSWLMADLLLQGAVWGPDRTWILHSVLLLEKVGYFVPSHRHLLLELHHLCFPSMHPPLGACVLCSLSHK